MREYKCTECGTPAQSKRANAKYCPVCRAYQNKLFLSGQTMKCLVCKDKFSPMTRNDKVCPKCDPNHNVLNVEGTCAYCKGTDTPLWNKDIAVCLKCIYDPNPKVQNKLISSLGRKQQARRAENNWPPTI